MAGFKMPWERIRDLENQVAELRREVDELKKSTNPHSADQKDKLYAKYMVKNLAEVIGL